MTPERQQALLRRLENADRSASWPLAEASYRNPALSYTDPVRFERERTVLFRQRPQLLGLSREIAQPGAYLTADLGGVPVLVVRQADGSLKGFVNACRHRGAPIAEANGKPRLRFSCPYHGWVYDADGALVARPYAEDAFGDVPAKDCALKPVAVAEGYGLVFAQAEGGEGLTAESALCGAEEEIAGYGLGSYTLIEGREREWPINWKLVLDTFCEAYHIRALHKATIAPDYLSDLSLFDSYGPHPRMIGLLKTVLQELDKPDGERRLLPYATAQCIFMPSGLITYQRDHIELWRVTPLAVDRTLVRTSLYAPTTPQSEKQWAYWRKNLDALLGVTGTEDFPLMMKIQQTLASGALPELIYGRNEPALIHLHRSIDRALETG